MQLLQSFILNHYHLPKRLDSPCTGFHHIVRYDTTHNVPITKYAPINILRIY
jgi:hypothetical protein